MLAVALKEEVYRLAQDELHQPCSGKVMLSD
jgi:hypothetical protein